jgi:hypothetical protein
MFGSFKIGASEAYFFLKQSHQLLKTKDRVPKSDKTIPI